MDIGVSQAGFDVRGCIELDKYCCQTLREAANQGLTKAEIFEGDIRSADALDFAKQIGERTGGIDLLFGGPPCQAFSSIGKQKALDDERGMLLFQMIRYTEALQPRVVLMEQVKGVLSAKDYSGRKGGVMMKLLEEFARLGYVAKYKVCLAANYGVPQLRERVFLVATKNKNGFNFPSPTHTSVQDIEPLFPLRVHVTAGEVLMDLSPPFQKIQGTTFYEDQYRNHVDVTPARDRERIHCVPEGDYLARQVNLPEELRRGLKPKDTTKFLRLNRAKPSNTLRCGEIFFHPTEDRYLTPREYMRLHGYPDEYLLKGPIRSRTGSVKDLDQHRQIANSVPPPMARAMAMQIREYISENE